MARRARGQRRGAARAAGAPPAGRGAAPPVRLAYTLAPGARASQYAALVTSDVGGAQLGGVAAAAPVGGSRRCACRSSCASRLGGQDARRWQRSLVIGPEPSTHVVPMTSFLPIDDASGPPPVTRVRSVLVVVDTTNTPPGQARHA